MSVDEDLHRRALGTAPEPVRPAGPRLGPLGWARWGWRTLTSMRTALVLLFLLAVAAIPGSVLPQRAVSPSQVAAYYTERPALAPVLDRLGFFAVFSSAWFSAIYLLLFVSLVGCVLPRSRMHWRAMRARPPAAPRHLARLPGHRELRTEAPPAAVVAAAREVLRRRRYRVEVTGDSVAAERGFLRETGNLLFHLALVVVLVAVAYGHLVGFRGNALIVSGDTFSSVAGAYDDIEVGPWFDEATVTPFTLTVDGFDVRYQEGGEQAGAPRDFRVDVTYEAEPGAPTREAVIASNAPLVLGGTKVFLTGNGYAPVITVRDGDGDVAWEGPAPFLPRDGTMTSTGVVKVPDARPAQIGIEGLFLPTARLDPGRGPISVFPDAREPRIFFTAYRGDLGLDSGVPQSVFRLDDSGLEQLREPGGDEVFARALGPGESVDLPDGLGSVSFDGVTRFVNLQVADDPGGPPALVGATLALGGLMLSLFVRRRRMWVRASPGPDGRTVVEVAGLSRTEEDGLADEVDAVADAVGAAVGTGDRPGPEEE